MDLITYEALYEIFRNEKSSSELQKLKDEFYGQTINYLNEKKAIIDSQQKKGDIFSTSELQKTKKQLENIKKILTELHEIRERKIIDLALFSSRSNDNLFSGNMTKEEVFLFNGAKEIFDSHRKDVLLNLLGGIIPRVEGKTKELKTAIKETKRLVRFIKTTPRFIAEDANIYGPFETEDIANIPEKSAELLVKNNKAKQI